MPKLDSIREVVKKIASIEELRGKICFFGGAMPYIYHGEESGRDHILLSDPTNGKWYMILMIYVDFIEFDERINYEKI